MSEDTAPLVITLKAGTGFDSPWIVVRGYDPADVVNKLNSLDGVIEATLEAAGLFTAQRSLGGKQQPAEAPPTEPAPQQRQQGWGVANRPTDGGSQGPTSSYQNSSHQTPAAAQQGAAPAQPPRSKFGGQLHPEGKTCDICPNVLEKKQTSSGKNVWRCNDWRWGNGDPNGHTSIFID